MVRDIFSAHVEIRFIKWWAHYLSKALAPFNYDRGTNITTTTTNINTSGHQHFKHMSHFRGALPLSLGHSLPPHYVLCLYLAMLILSFDDEIDKLTSGTHLYYKMIFYAILLIPTDDISNTMWQIHLFFLRINWSLKGNCTN